MLAYLSYGALLGLSAGITPGPLLTLVISHTLRHGAREGVKVAVAPLMTDLPIICLTLLLFSNLPDLSSALGIASLIGGAFVLFLGIQALLQGPVHIHLSEAEPRSYLKGALVNALNPHPYLFWLTVGVPTIIKASKEGLAPAVGFGFCFFSFIVGSKVSIALLTGKSRQFLSGAAYLWTARLLGFLLACFAVALFHEGLSLLGVL
jgi:threonine/homoserine/homoserine lactone efflux protein